MSGQPGFDIPTTTDQPKNNNRTILFVLGGLLLLVVVLAIVGFVIFQSLSSRSNAIPQLLSANTQVYVTLTPNLADVAGIERIQAAYPDLFANQDTSSLNEQLAEELGVNFETDIAPWVDREMAIAVSGLDDLSALSEDLEADAELAEAADIAVLIASRDDGQAQAFLDKQRAYRTENKGATFEESTHSGTTIYTQTGDDENPLVSFALVKKHVIFASSAEVITAIIDRDTNGADTLAKSANFQSVQETLPETQIGYFYFDGSLFVQLAEAAQEQQSELFTPEQSAQMQEQMDSLKAVQGMGLSISVVDAGLQFDMLAAINRAALSAENLALVEEASTPVAADLIDTIRDDSITFFTFNIPASFRDQIMDAIAAQPDGLEMLAEYESQVGLSLEDDFLSWFAGNAALVIAPGEQIGDITIPVTGYFRLRPLDRAAAEAGMGRIGVVLEQAASSMLGLSLESQEIGGTSWQVIPDPENQAVFGGYGFIGDDLVIGVGQTALESASTGRDTPITTSPTYQAAQGSLYSPNSGVFFLDNTKLLTVLQEANLDSELGPEFTEAVGPIRAITLSAQPGLDDQGKSRGRVVIFIGE